MRICVIALDPPRLTCSVHALNCRLQADKDAAAEQRALYHDPRCTSPQLSPASRQRADTFEELYSVLSPDSRNRTDSDARFDDLMRTSESEVHNDTIPAVSPPLLESGSR